MIERTPERLHGLNVLKADGGDIARLRSVVEYQRVEPGAAIETGGAAVHVDDVVSGAGIGGDVRIGIAAGVQVNDVVAIAAQDERAGERQVAGSLDDDDGV